MKKLFSTFFLLAFICLTITAKSQELISMPLGSRVSQSSLIVEGKVIGKKSFVDKDNLNIYTANEVEVYKVFKGSLDTGYIQIITPGGTIGLQKEVVHPSLELIIGDVGVFMMRSNSVLTTKKNNAPLYQPYASVQGFVKYNLAQNTASSVFDQFSSIEQELYNTISDLSGEAYTEVVPFSIQAAGNSGIEATPTISSFTPTTVTAGTKSLLTINGDNFGTAPGNVGFANADDGGASFTLVLSTQIVSWSNTEIVVEVPSKAGTGAIFVENTDPANGTSVASLSVSYAEINALSDAISAGTLVSYLTQHSNRNSAGGYTLQMFTDFNADANAKASFFRAFNTWTSCAGTKINWTIGAVTTTDAVADDGINIVRHDNGSELPNGVLGRCTSRFSGCFDGAGGIDWYVKEIDIVFDDGTNWNYGPSAPTFTQYDFETVAVHELGHGHQLAHVISPGAIMHFSISKGSQNRTLSVDDLAGGNDVMSRSTTTSICGEGAMYELPCDMRWDGGAGTSNWADANNWRTDVVPTSTEKVTLDNMFISGNYTINLNSSKSIEDLEINMASNAVTLSGGNSLNITNVVTPTSGTLNSNGQLVLKAANSTEYGQLATGSGSISGNIVNEWYFDGSNGYRHLASPVVCDLSELSDDFNTLNYSAGSTGSVWSWDNTANNWVTPVGGNSASFNQAVSVFIGTSTGSVFSSLPLTVDATGLIVTGNQSQALGYSTTSAAGVVFENGADGWNFVYNPYPSALQWSLVEADGAFPAELASTYYYWDVNVGGYASYNPITLGINGATDFIAKGKAFWVQASSAPSSGLSFTDAMRTVSEQPAMKTTTGGVSNQITISAKAGAIEDHAYYGEFFGATAKYDKAFDHLKLNADRGLSVSISSETLNLAYNIISKIQYPLPFEVTTKSAGPIEIGVQLASDFTGAKPKYIQNKRTGEAHPLKDGNFTFQANANEEYSLIILNDLSDGVALNQPFFYARQGILGVNLNQNKNYSKVEVFDISGRLIKSTDIDNNSQIVELELNKSGLFIVQLKSLRGLRYSEKVVLFD